MWLPPPAVINHNIIDSGPSRRRRRRPSWGRMRPLCLTLSRTLIRMQIIHLQWVDNLQCTFKCNSSQYNFLFFMRFTRAVCWRTKRLTPIARRFARTNRQPSQPRRRRRRPPRRRRQAAAAASAQLIEGVASASFNSILLLPFEPCV